MYRVGEVFALDLTALRVDDLIISEHMPVCIVESFTEKLYD
jgi:hypothetical protein